MFADGARHLSSGNMVDSLLQGLVSHFAVHSSAMSALPADHKTLVEQVTRGDETALGELIARHLPRLEVFLRRRADRLVLAKESVSDLAQSVCREALKDVAGFEYQGEAAFVRWFQTLALSKIIEKRRYYTAQKRDAGRDVDLAGAVGRDGPTPTMGEVYATLVTRHAWPPERRSWRRSHGPLTS